MPARPAPVPPDEEARLAALRSYEVLDTAPEQEFDNLTRLVALICGAPIALVALVDAERQWFKSRLGFEPTKTSREIAFCAHAILGTEILEVGDTLDDERFATNPLVTGEPGIRFYAGAPLRASGGHSLGTLCVLDRVPRRLEPSQRQALRTLADEVMARLELRRQALEMRRAEEGLRVLNRVVEASPTGVLIADAREPDLPLVYVNATFERLTGYTAAEALGRNCRYLQGTDRDQPELARLREALTSAQPVTVTLRNYRKDGTLFWNELRVAPATGPDGTLTHFVGIQTDVTERKRLDDELRRSEAQLEAELARRSAQLRESEERFRLIAENSRDLIALYDEEGRYVYASPSHKTVLGYEIEELMRFDRADLVPAEDCERLPPLGEQATPVEFRLRKADGTYLWIEGTSYWITSGGRRLIVGMGHDVTERVKAVRALRDSEARYRSVLENIEEIVFAGDLRQDPLVNPLTLVSPHVEKVLGLSPESFLGGADLWSSLIHPDDAAAVRESTERSIAQGRPVTRQYRLRNIASGEYRWMEDTFAPQLEDGRAIGFFGTARDVTERKQAEDELQRTQHFLQRIVNTIPGIVYVYDLQARRNVFASQELPALLGYKPAQLQAMGSELMEQLVHPEDLPRLLEAHRGYLTVEDDRSFETEYRAKHASGEWRTLRSREAAFERTGRIVRQIVGVAVDVTGQRRTELLLQQAQRVEAIGRLAGGIAHDFNNILGVITGYGELAQRQIGPEHPARPRVDQMIKAAARAAGLTRQLLAFSRKQVMQPKVLDLNGVVADTHKMLGRLIGEDVDLAVRAAPGLGTVKADPGQIEQVILNLAVNARDAMPKGGSLTLETANVDLGEDYAAAHPPVKPGRYVLLAVSDTGIGMDQETQLRIFEPFFTTKPEGQGTGLGLATVHGIVQQSGGHISVHSEPGHGTAFKVYLPRVDEPAAAARTGETPAAAPRGQETILLVEDTETLREVIREVLEEQGYTLLMASHGEEALDLAREHKGPIHLLLTDVVMPRLGGGDLARLLAAPRPGIRVLYMSGYMDGAISQHGVSGEGVVLLEKPFTGDQLARAVRAVLDRPTPT